MIPESVDRLDIAKVAGIFIAIGSGLFALWQYHYAQEREFKKVFFEKQLAVVTEVFDVLAEMDAARSDEERKAAAAKFWIIYQGKGRAFLDSTTFQALRLPAEYVAGCVTKVRKPKTISCENFSASMTAPAFANVAREQMSQVWDLSFSSIAMDDPWSPPSK